MSLNNTYIFTVGASKLSQNWTFYLHENLRFFDLIHRPFYLFQVFLRFKDILNRKNGNFFSGTDIILSLSLIILDTYNFGAKTETFWLNLEAHTVFQILIAFLVSVLTFELSFEIIHFNTQILRLNSTKWLFWGHISTSTRLIKTKRFAIDSSWNFLWPTKDYQQNLE